MQKAYRHWPVLEKSGLSEFSAAFEASRATALTYSLSDITALILTPPLSQTTSLKLIHTQLYQ
jgi:hypothetical protein